MARRTKFSAPLTVLLAVICLAVGCGIGAFGMGVYDALSYTSDEAPRALINGELQIHFPELGNKYTGDCTYIKAGDTDILIDAGSRTSSVDTICNYLDRYVTDGKLEYVIVTHAHEDHYAGFSILNGSIFDRYECETIIDFSMTNQEDKGASNMYGRYLMELADEVKAGAKHYTAAECVADEALRDGFSLGDQMTLKILDSRYYTEKASTENNYSVCALLSYGDYRYLFTGDLEAEGEAALAERNQLSKVDLYKAGHHGSKTSSSEALLSVIQPSIVCVCCCCGSPEYTKTDENQFPTQAFVDRVAPYTDQVYVTTRCVDYQAGKFESMNGDITVVTDKEGVHVLCSADPRLLREWPWFAEHRKMPSAWKNAA